MGVAVGVLVVLGVTPAGAEVGRPRVLPDVPVTAVALEQGRSNNSPAIAVDPRQPGFVALASRVDLPSFSCSLHVSGDGGRGWVPANPVRRLPAGAERCYAPEMAFDGKGRLYYLFVGLRGPANTPMGVYLTSSDDYGHSFSAPRRVLGPDNFAVRMAIDPTLGRRGRIHLVWLTAGAPPSLGGLPPTTNPIVAAHSDDGGRHFSRPVQVSDPERGRVVAPALALGPSHQVHVAYYDLGNDARDYQGLEGPTWDGTWSLIATSSADGGDHFGRGTVVDDTVVPPERVLLIFTMPPPSLAAGPSGVYAAWYDDRNGDWDVWLRRSTDQGKTWGDRQRLNDDPVGNGRHQYLPRLSVAGSGRIDAVYYDRRDDPQNLRNHVRFTSSGDGGATFAPSVAVTAEPSNSRIGPTYPIPSAAGLIDFGSRLGLASVGDRAFVAWTDTRNSLPGEQQDVFATEVDFGGARPVAQQRSDGPGTAPTLAVLAGLCAALAVGAILVTRRRRHRTRFP